MILSTTLFIDTEIPDDVEIPSHLKFALCEQMTADMIDAINEHIHAKSKRIIKGKTKLIEGKFLGDVKVQKIDVK